MNVSSICVLYVTIHMEAINKSVKYMCTICDYQETDKGNLERHKEIKGGAIGLTI